MDTPSSAHPAAAPAHWPQDQPQHWHRQEHLDGAQPGMCQELQAKQHGTQACTNVRTVEHQHNAAPGHHTAGPGAVQSGSRPGKRARKRLRQQAVACNAALASESHSHGHQQHNGTGRSAASSAAAMHLQGPGYSKNAKQRCKQHKPAPQNSVPSASMPTDASAPAQAPAQHGQRTQSDASAKREASALEAGKVQEAAKPEMKNKFAQRLKARPYKKSVASVNASGSAPASLHGISQAAPAGVTAPVPVADLVVHG